MRAEVRIAGFVGGPDLKAKAIANNAEERLAEARALEEKIKTRKPTNSGKNTPNRLTSQRTKKNSRDPEVTEKLDNITERNQKILEKVKNKTPEQARKGLEKAINQTEKARTRVTGLNKSGNKIPENNRRGAAEKKVEKASNLSMPDKTAEKIGKNTNRTNISAPSNMKKQENLGAEATGKSTLNKPETSKDMSLETKKNRLLTSLRAAKS